ncbi:hypothetical protein HPB50_007633 [Hyalomma asiaticum]|uniref:Uncharacterized protein n=1 Tax=Hyalomma asiaticum TaxID=266040 RepID=A0ACB7S113_HYAAI|nr:hypothetical protein HPB50_007633 [Hyalomma asiaticum]
MPLVNWSEATPEDLAGFTADFLREELVRRDLDSAGSKEEVINRLIADIAQNRLTTSQLPPPDSAAPSQRPHTTSPPTFDAAQTHPSPALHSTLSETLDGSLVQCALVNATIAGIGQVDAFPDSGSKVTLVSRHLVSSLPLLPWTRPPLVVVGGTTVAPAVSSTEESTTQMSGPSAASVLQPAAAPYAYRGDGALWSQNSPYYGLIDAPMPSSTAALYASQPSAMTDTFALQTAAAPGSHWVIRPPPHGGRWSQTYRPFPLPVVFPEVPVDEDADGKSALPTLRNIGVASITAVFLAVVIVVALAVESSVPIIETGTSEMSRVVERVHSGDIGIPGPWQPIHAPIGARKSVAVPPRLTTASPQRVIDHSRALPHAPRSAASTATPRATVGMASKQRRSRNQAVSSTEEYAFP